MSQNVHLFIFLIFVATLPGEITNHFTSGNYLLLFNASYYLHSPSTASGARHMRSACTIDTDMFRLADRLVATWAEFQHIVVHYATDQCQKRLEACIKAEGGQPEHLL